MFIRPSRWTCAWCGKKEPYYNVKVLAHVLKFNAESDFDHLVYWGPEPEEGEKSYNGAELCRDCGLILEANIKKAIKKTRKKCSKN